MLPLFSQLGVSRNAPCSTPFFLLFHLEQQLLINAVIFCGFYKNAPLIRLPQLICQVDCIEYINAIVEYA
jgi:hypothetical protein